MSPDDSGHLKTSYNLDNRAFILFILFPYDLFDDAVSNSKYLPCNDCIITG
jgi:hypothetical protein